MGGRRSCRLEYPAYCKIQAERYCQPSGRSVSDRSFAEHWRRGKEDPWRCRAGYPYKTPQELGCQSVDEAYYATHAAIHTAIVNGSLDKWSIQSGDTARNTRVLNAFEKNL